MTSVARQPHLTFRGNQGLARHGWLRLTPAYGVALVEKELAAQEAGCVVLDPFSGTGTTGLAASTLGLHAQLVDLNPFLVWLARVKTREYTLVDAHQALVMVDDIAREATSRCSSGDLWKPNLSNIARWWPRETLAGLSAVFLGISNCGDLGPACDLMKIAFCQTLIDCSSAAFNHQSMSFKTRSSDAELLLPLDLDGESLAAKVVDDFRRRAQDVISECEPNPPGAVEVHLGDARRLRESVNGEVDLLVTSPPYCNRMSYIRELRPYMYWLGYLDHASAAGELDWQAIGGTWGVATSRLLSEEIGEQPPVGSEFNEIVDGIAATPGERNARLLSRYVTKYFSDVWKHVESTVGVVKRGGHVVYIVGNSTFFGRVVPTERWYAKLLCAAGYKDVSVERIRKRNSNKLLYEFAVRATRA